MKRLIFIDATLKLMGCVFLGGVVSSAPATPNAWTGLGDGADWFDGANWSAGVPAAAQEVTVDAGTLLLTNETAELASFRMTGGTLTFSNWTTRLQAVDVVLTNAATLTHRPQSATTANTLGAWVPDARVWIVCSNFTLGTEAVIDADGQGYALGKGPGSKNGRYGGSHGGFGSPGYGEDWSRPLPYGMAADPVEPGSGGGNSVGGPGGGAVRIEASGQVALHGSIEADGRGYVNTHGAGGSGGSIAIRCRTLVGSETGLLSARGGNSTTSGGAGAGGRIAVVYDPEEQASLVPVNPGVRFRAAAGMGGANTFAAEPGTLYFPDTAFLSGHMSAQWMGGNLHLPGFGSWALDAFDVLGDFGLPTVTNLVVAQAMTVTGHLRLYASPTNAASPDYGMLLDVGGALAIAGELALVSDPTNGATIRVQCDSMTLAQGGAINADYCGYQWKYGPGAGQEGAGAGGSHGGQGSPGFDAWSYRKPVTGDPAQPVFPGSGGGNSLGSYGGGAVRIYASNALSVQGTISANGGKGIETHGSGGAGGSILLVCDTFLGDPNGLLQARGGNGTATDHDGGAGGGGRIAVLYDPVSQSALPDPNPGVRFDVRAGVSAEHAYLAEDGTVYFPDQLFLSGRMSTQWQRGNIILPDFDTWELESLEIAGQFSLPSMTNLTVAGDMILLQDAALTLVAASTNQTLSDCGMFLKVGGRLTLETNAMLRLVSDLHTGASPYLECGQLALQGESVIDADRVGFDYQAGSGRGIERGGGGHGGMGASGSGGGTPGATYDDEHAPLLPGSGGGNGNDGGGRGGGAVRIGVHGAARLDGTVQARGMYRKRYHGGGGSGGTILISANKISGQGTIRANGGNTSNYGGAGGGGRVAIWTPFLPLPTIRDMAENGLPGSAEIVDPAREYPDLLLTASPGTGGAAATQAAEAGTIFCGRQVRGTVLLVR